MLSTNTNKRIINSVILHSSKSDIGTLESLKSLHIKNGMKDIGYHFVIERDGKVQKGRPISQVGEHLSGRNLDSIGVCLIGAKDFSDDQLISLGTLLQALLSQHRNINNIYRHKDVDKDGCFFIDSAWFDKKSEIITQ